MVNPLARWSVVKYLKKVCKCSERQACVIVGLPGSLVRYIVKQRTDEAELIKRIHWQSVMAGMATVRLWCCSSERAGE